MLESKHCFDTASTLVELVQAWVVFLGLLAQDLRIFPMRHCCGCLLLFIQPSNVPWQRVFPSSHLQHNTTGAGSAVKPTT